MSVGLKNVFSTTVRWLQDRGYPHRALALCESTSLLAKAEAFSHPAMFVHIAEQQTHGRGRHDHTWSAPPEGSGLTATWSFQVNTPPQHLTAPLVGYFVYQALHKNWPDLPWSLKPPNDIYLGAKKVAGLLIETISRGHSHCLLIGFGFNALKAPLHVPQATCLADHTSLSEESWCSFLNLFSQEIQQALELCGHGELTPSMRQNLLEAIRQHPQFQDLEQISADGDLQFADRIINWYSL